MSDGHDRDRLGRTGLSGAGLGIELAAALIGFALLGLWVDHRWATGPWGTLIAVAIGLVGGFYNFIRSSLQILNKPAFRPDTKGKGDEKSDVGSS